MIRIISAILVVLMFVSLLAVVAAPRPAAAGPTEEQPLRDAPQCQAGESVRLLLLMDTSGSLKSSDPNERRWSGARSAVEALSQVASANPDVDVQLYIASFDSDYTTHSGWIKMGTQQAYAEAVEAVSDTISDDGIWTNYGAALAGTHESLTRHRRASCDIILWFTDGAHDTHKGTSPREAKEIDGICEPSGPAGKLKEHGAFAVAVELVDPPAAPAATLRRIVGGTRGAECSYIPGYVISTDDVDALADLLSLTASLVAWKAVDPPPVPLSRCVPPPEDQSGCVFRFDISDSVDAFELYMQDLSGTSPRRMTITAPDGTENQVSWPDSPGFAPVGSLSLLAESVPARSWAKIIAHRAALPKGHPWAGEWTVHYPSDFDASVRINERTTPPVSVAISDSGDLTVGSHADALIAYLQVDSYRLPMTQSDLSRPASSFDESCDTGEWLSHRRGKVEFPHWLYHISPLSGNGVSSQRWAQSDYKGTAEASVVECVRFGPSYLQWAGPEPDASLTFELPAPLRADPDVFANSFAISIEEPPKINDQGHYQAAATITTSDTGSHSAQLRYVHVPPPSQDDPVLDLSDPPAGFPNRVMAVATCNDNSVIDSTADRFECKATVRLAAPLSEGFSASATAVVTVTDADADLYGVPHPLPAYDRPAEMANAYSQADYLAVAIATILSILALFPIWALFRLLSAARIRPWPPSPSPRTATLEFDIEADSWSETQWGFEPAVAQKATSMTVGTVKVASRWGPAVMHLTRATETASKESDTFVIEASEPDDPAGAYALEAVDNKKLRLTVWGFPEEGSDDEILSSAINRSKDAAEARIDNVRSFRPAANGI